MNASLKRQPKEVKSMTNDCFVAFWVGAMAGMVFGIVFAAVFAAIANNIERGDR